MTAQTSTLSDIRAALDCQGGLDRVMALPGFEELSGDLVDAILEEASKFATEVLEPLNQPGDRQGRAAKTLSVEHADRTEKRARHEGLRLSHRTGSATKVADLHDAEAASTRA